MLTAPPPATPPPSTSTCSPPPPPCPPQHKYMLTGHFSYYHGEAINPKHLSLFER
jgi:hypothetical protein